MTDQPPPPFDLRQFIVDLQEIRLDTDMEQQVLHEFLAFIATPQVSSVDQQKKEEVPEVDAPLHECSICMEDITAETEHVIPCRHKFHSKCIHDWKKMNDTCPLCRRPF